MHSVPPPPHPPIRIIVSCNFQQKYWKDPHGVTLFYSVCLVCVPPERCACCLLAQEEQPADFRYTHMWVSSDGETHLKECAMKGFEMKKFAETEQWVKPTESPTKVRRDA